MDIRQFRVVVRARSFERTCRFYGESLALPRVQSWDREDARGAVFQAGPALVEVLGRPAGSAAGRGPRDEEFDYQGPQQKMTLTLLVPSAEDAYRELLFRDKNIPGGLRHDEDGSLIFETHDPDGIKVVYRQAGA
ncbi:MAG TPA: VOC family protein [Thermoanaerobaculia bacterium]|jgi:catechol 2,3-dioxygenase-like lactoylglutathione lyase family enzyme